MGALERIDGWSADHAAAAVVRADGVLASHGALDRELRWASVTKLATATAALVAAEEGVVALDDPAGPRGSTVRHLLAHASGLPFGSREPIARPGARRIYSNAGFEILAEVVEDRADMSFDEYLAAAVFEPLGMRASRLRGSAGADVFGPLSDLVLFAGELLGPSLVGPETLEEATSVAFPGLGGVVPGLGRHEPCDWGLGFELRDGKDPHWTGRRNSPRTFGHFGGSGTFLWVDPDVGLACASLTDRAFGDWALRAWPDLSDAVLAEFAGVPL